MRVISTSPSFRAAVGSLILFVPLAGFETLLASRMPWWNLPFRSIAWSAGIAALFCIPLGIAFLRGSAWVHGLAVAIAVTWVAFSAGLSIRLRHPGLGYFVLFLGVSCYLILGWIRRELGRSFFDPNLSWYQGLPKGIPGLSCELSDGEIRTSWRVGRIDREGVFIFSESARPPGFAKSNRGNRELLFRFRDREMRCAGVAMRELGWTAGAGFRFAGFTLDQKKEMGDFIEALRGEGYVD